MRSLGLLHLNMLSVLDAAGFRLSPWSNARFPSMPGRIEKDIGWIDSGPVDGGRDGDAAVRPLGGPSAASRAAPLAASRTSPPRSSRTTSRSSAPTRWRGATRRRAGSTSPRASSPSSWRARARSRPATTALLPAHRIDHAQGRSGKDDGHVDDDARWRPFGPPAVAKPRSFTYGHDFLAAAVSGVAEGSLVYVGHGYVIKEKNLDAYKGLDVKGKILVSHSGYPPGVSRNDVRGPSGEQWESAVTYAAKNGGKGVIYIPSFDALTRWDRNRNERAKKARHGWTARRRRGRRNRKCRQSPHRRRCWRRSSRTRR